MTLSLLSFNSLYMQINLQRQPTQHGLLDQMQKRNVNRNCINYTILNRDRKDSHTCTAAYNWLV